MDAGTQGVFWAGGEVVGRTRPGLEREAVLRHQSYAEYFIPRNPAPGAVPIVFAHTQLSGVIWRTTPDGREGWADYFLRKGFPVFAVDPPGSGRAGFEIDDIDHPAGHDAPPDGAGPLVRSDTSAWTRWNIGPAFGTPRDGGQFPADEPALRHYLASLNPLRVIPNATMDASFVALLEKVREIAGAAVFVGWSLAGGLGQRLAIARPDLVRGVVALEGGKGEPTSAPPPSAGQAGWFDNFHLGAPDAPGRIVATLAAHGIPLLSVNGEANHSGNTGHSRQLGQELVDAVNAAGGTATNIYLPDHGLTGNSHMFFWERNSHAIADIVIGWIRANVSPQP